MPISIECPECFKQYRVKEAAAGKRFKCKQCGHRITISQSDPDDLYDFADQERGPSKSRRESDGMPPPVRKRKKKKKRGPSKSRRSEPRSDTNPTAITMGILCILHTGGIGFFGWSYLGLLFRGEFAFGSLLSVAGMIVGVVFFVAGIGILIKAAWSVELANWAAIAILALLGINFVNLLFSMMGSDLPSGMAGRFIGSVFFGIAKEAVIPGIVLWWTAQGPEL